MDALGNQSSYTYDAGNNILSLTTKNGSGRILSDESRSYDILNRLIKKDTIGSGALHTTLITYDL